MKTVKQIQNEIFTMYYQTPFKGLSKRQFVELGLQNALKFLEINGLPVPNITIHEHSNPKHSVGYVTTPAKEYRYGCLTLPMCPLIPYRGKGDGHIRAIK